MCCGLLVTLVISPLVLLIQGGVTQQPPPLRRTTTRRRAATGVCDTWWRGFGLDACTFFLRKCERDLGLCWGSCQHHRGDGLSGSLSLLGWSRSVARHLTTAARGGVEVCVPAPAHVHAGVAWPYRNEVTNVSDDLLCKNSGSAP